MNTAVVANLDDERLIREGEQAVDQYNSNLKNARARIMPMARGLLAAKRKYPATQDFGDWLLGSSYREIEKDERAALIKIGECETFAVKYVRTTCLISPRTIWDAIQELIPPRPESSSHDANSSPTSISTPESLPAIAQPAENVESPTPNPAPFSSISQRSPFYGLPRAAEVIAIYLAKETRVDLGKIVNNRGGKEIWALILASIDAGFLTPTKMGFTRASLRILFPLADRAYCHRFDLTNPRQRNQVKEELLPAMIACRDQLLAAPDNIATILSAYQTAQAAKQVAVVKAERHAVAVKALPLAEKELVMFGQPVWPRPDGNQGEYTYDQVRAAIWTFRDYEAWNVMAKEDVESLAKRIRNSQRYLGEYVLRTGRDNPLARVYSLIQWFSRLMERNPQGECKWPMYPHIEGQW